MIPRGCSCAYGRAARHGGFGCGAKSGGNNNGFYSLPTGLVNTAAAIGLAFPAHSPFSFLFLYSVIYLVLLLLLSLLILSLLLFCCLLLVSQLLLSSSRSWSSSLLQRWESSGYRRKYDFLMVPEVIFEILLNLQRKVVCVYVYYNREFLTSCAPAAITSAILYRFSLS